MMSMKYTSSQINAMSWKEWTETMAKELNDAGFRTNGVKILDDGTLEKGLVPFSVNGEPKYFLLGSVDKAEEIEYLKSLGLLNNGRCPMCGEKIIGNPGRFTSGYDSNYHFQVCQNCVRNGNRTYVNPANNQGCMIALVLFPWNIIKHILCQILYRSGIVA